MSNFGHSKFLPVFLGKIVRKNLEQSFLAILNFYQFFWEKLLENFEMAIFGHFKFSPSIWEKLLEEIQNGKKMAVPNFSDNFFVHITLIECNGLESIEICTFLDFKKFFEKILLG